MRYAASPITPAGFDSAPAAQGVAAPNDPGTDEKLRLAVPTTATYIAVRASDAAGNLGAEVSVPIR